VAYHQAVNPPNSYRFFTLLWYYFLAMPRPPETPRPPEQERQPYYLASRFPTKQAAEQPYLTVQHILHDMECDLSAYRFMRQWQEPNPNTWYVLVIGEKPQPAVE